MSNALNPKFDESPCNGVKETKMSMEDDEELTESRIKAFLDEKVLHAHYTALIMFLTLTVINT